MREPSYIYEDSEILVVDKPAGMIVHPAPGHEEQALTDFVVRHDPSIKGVGSEERPGIVHRLDIWTSGVMVIAKTPRAYSFLRRQFEEHSRVRKTYLAVVHGVMQPKSGELRTMIGRKAWDAKRMAVVESGGKVALTKWNVLEKKGRISIVEFEIETGRMHQIRVHASYLGHPIVGDELYGEKSLDRQMSLKPRRQLLHAVAISFQHPKTGKPVSFVAPPPADIVFAR